MYYTGIRERVLDKTSLDQQTMKMIFLIWCLLPVAMSKLQEDETWTVQVYENDVAVLYCNDSEAMIAVGDKAMWKTPQNTVLKAGHNDKDYEVQTHKGIPGFALKVKKVTEDRYGIYSCTIYRSDNSTMTILRGINLSGPNYRKLTDKYNHNIIVAVVASAVFIVPLVGLCLLYKFRYQDKSQKYDRQTQGMTETVAAKLESENGAYDNPASKEFTRL